MFVVSLKADRSIEGFKELRVDSRQLPYIDERTIIAYKRDWDPQLLEAICSCSPFALDLDWTTPQEHIDWIKKRYPHVRLLISYHNFDETPKELKSILKAMPRADFYKLACMANSALDSLRMLCEVKENVIALCMGELGKITRILAHRFKAPWNYVCLEGEVCAPGQMSYDALHQYNLGAKRLYALIGDPVDQSLSHTTHNQFSDVLYVKIALKKEEVDAGIALMRTLGFRGASVTMPHKRHFSKEPINTLTFEKEVKMHNTDGMSARRLLEKKCQLFDARVLILGRGATGRAIENALRGVCQQLDTWNRPDKLPSERYDVIVQATSAEFKGESIDFSSLLYEGQTVLEVIQFETQFVKDALKAGCHVIRGSEMFALQAAFQFEVWEKIPVEKGVEQIAQMWQTHVDARSRSK